MLLHNDLETYLSLVDRSASDPNIGPHQQLESILHTDQSEERRLFSAEIWRLLRSCEIANTAGDASNHAVRTLEKIATAIESETKSVAAPANEAVWQRAILCAQRTPDTADVPKNFDPNPRNRHVGEACRALRARGFVVDINSFGPHIDDQTQLEIAKHVDLQIERVGGVNTLTYLFRLMCQHNLLHDGLWLFGNQIASKPSDNRPTIPVGWLISLALRHIHKTQTSLDSTPLHDGIDLAIDFAAAMNCQRYNRFDGITELHPTELMRAFDEAMRWHVLFTLPQVPVQTLNVIRHAFATAGWSHETRNVRRDVDLLLKEGIELLRNRKTSDLIQMSKETAQRRFPSLMRMAYLPHGDVNQNYLRPFDAEQRNHQSYVFFDTAGEKILSLAPSLAACAVYIAAFERIWTTLNPKVAEPIVSNVVERAIYLTCLGKATDVSQNIRYQANGQQLEIDVFCRDNHNRFFFEAKSKALTRAAESDNTLEFIEDFVGGFLVALRQLVRHDRNAEIIDIDITAHTRESTYIDNVKVAVSSLSFGPVMDKSLSNTLFRAASQSRFEVTTDDVRTKEIINEFDSIIREIEIEIERFPEDRKLESLFQYLISVFWMDVGQLIYLTNRADSLEDALHALRNVTFSTRDFWTEVASLDRTELSAKWLRPPSR